MLWSPEVDWSAPAGRTLRKLLQALPSGREYEVTLFGSAPLQLTLESTFTSADVDLFTPEDSEDALAAAIVEARLGKGQADVYVQLCAELNFRTSPRWRTRAFTTHLGNVRITLPHPIDILIAKLHRLAPKDLDAYRLVIDRLGSPTEQELRGELQAAVDLYRPGFDEEISSDITTNTRVLWQELWGQDINVRQEIIAPALARMRAGYAADIPEHDYKADLRRMAEE